MGNSDPSFKGAVISAFVLSLLIILTSLIPIRYLVLPVLCGFSILPPVLFGFLTRSSEDSKLTKGIRAVVFLISLVVFVFVFMIILYIALWNSLLPISLSIASFGETIVYLFLVLPFMALFYYVGELLFSR